MPISEGYSPPSPQKPNAYVPPKDPVRSTSTMPVITTSDWDNLAAATGTTPVKTPKPVKPAGVTSSGNRDDYVSPGMIAGQKAAEEKRKAIALATAVKKREEALKAAAIAAAAAEKARKEAAAKAALAAAGQSVETEGGVISISHDDKKSGNKDGDKTNKGGKGAVFTQNNDGGGKGGWSSLSVGDGKGGKKNDDFGGSTAVAVGSNSSVGLSDIQKVRKFSFQIEKAEGKLGTLAAQESQIRAAMGGTTDPAQQQQLAMQLGSVQQQQQKVTDRLQRKEDRLSNVKNRMASAGTSDQLNQGVKAVVIGESGKKDNGPKNGGGNGNNQAQGGIGTKLVNVGGPDSGRPQAGDLKPVGNKNDGPKVGGGGQFDTGASIPHINLNGIGGPDGGRPQAANLNPGRGNGNQGNGNGNGGGDGNRAGQGGGGNALAGIGGPDSGRPQAVALGNGDGGGNGNGNQGNGNGNGGGDGNRAGQGGGDNALGGGNGGRPQAVALGSGGGNGGQGGGGNGNGNGNKNDNDGPKLMGGPVGGGVKNDSLPTNPPKLVSLGGGGGGTGAGKFGKNR